MYEKIRKVLAKFPALKAREIARKIDEERNKVSAFLHDNLDKFEQDDEYRWSLVDLDKLIIEFDNGWINCKSFEETLLRSGSPLEKDVSSVVFVLQSKCKFMLDALARLLALSNQLADKGVSVTIDFGKGSAFHYLNRMGFFDHLLSSVEILPERPENSTAQRYSGNSKSLVELRAIQPHEAWKPIVDQLSNCFVSLSNEVYDTVASTIFSELIGNIGEHSETHLIGFAGLQKYEGKRPHIQTIVSDSGLGIAATLRSTLKEKHPDLYRRFKNVGIETDVQLVNEAISKGNISRYGGARGLGFKSSKEQALKFEADLSVRQENFSLEFHLNNGVFTELKVSKNLPKISGTHICFDFYID